MRADIGKTTTWKELSRVQRQQVLNQAISTALDAGVILRDYLTSPSLKNQRTEADLIVERLIRTQLCTAFSQWGFRAEEEPDLNQVVDPECPFWLVDPNDGTSAFLKGERGASVSIALISEGVPILGVIYAYGAPHHGGDLFSWAEGGAPLCRNGKPITEQWTSDWNESICFISNSADQIASAYQHCLTTPKGTARYRTAPGVAYRLALCAAKEGELAISLASPRDFDLAAGHALIRGAGGEIFDERGEVIRYLHHRAHRVGFAFGGSMTHAKYATQLEWRPTFEALRQPQSVPFLKPSEVQLSSDVKVLDAMQGAWWGWHIGTALERDLQMNDQELDYQDPHEQNSINTHVMRLETAHRHGDLNLIIEARSLIKNCSQINDSTLHQTLSKYPTLRLFFEAFFDEQQGEQESQSCSTPRSELPLTSRLGLKWGYRLGRTALPTRIISELLSWRDGHIETWQPDGDRLIEQLLTLIPFTPTNH